MSDLAGRRAAFRRLHESGCFAMPNPWDAGSARYLQHLGFPALATTSAGFAFSIGLPDGAGAVTRDLAVAHVRDIAGATDVPVNADFESGYADRPEGVGESVRLCVAAGASGLSIEDSTGDARRPLFELSEALDRLRAAREAIDGTGVLLTARAECYLVGHADAFAESLRRLRAYAEAGADVLYAPGVRDTGQIAEIVRAVAPKPVNLLVSGNVGLTMADAAALGVRRVSVGGALARAAWGGFQRAATLLSREGRFEGFDGAMPFDDLQAFFAAWPPRRM